MWKRIRAKLGADWPLILATLLAANLVFILLLQMQRTAIYGQQVSITNAVRDAIKSLNSAEETRSTRANLFQNDILANFKQVQLGTNQIPVFAIKQQAALETIQRTLNDAMANLAQVQLGTNQIPSVADKQLAALETIQRTLNDAVANLTQVQLGTNRIPQIASDNSGSLERIETSLKQTSLLLARVEKLMATMPKVERP